MPRNRIKELRTVRAGDLIPDARNPRVHSEEQRQVLQGVLERVGWVDAVLVRETPEGLKTVDGHLRADLDPDAMIPALVLDIDETEAGEVLATLDPLVEMAEFDEERLGSLLTDLLADADETWADLLETLHALPLDLEPEDTGSLDAPDAPDTQEDDQAHQAEYVLIRFEVPARYRREIIAKLAPILASYGVDVDQGQTPTA